MVARAPRSASGELVWNQEVVVSWSQAVVVSGGFGRRQWAKADVPAGVPWISRLLSPQKAPESSDEMRHEPPSEDEMAAWLSAIITGGCGDGDDIRAVGGDHRALAVEPNEQWAENIEKLPRREEKRDMNSTSTRMPKLPA
ncbi:hypothetical protein E2562_036426 [Oryza meyeriana var. granulata]|uniref:Uncharacterized protein n=1 Tax=Oryza meyeriana var. granulata TaxID=110450 RepID=A0A6G1BQ16_9ORYZ|nr:hypothetical protein E2562_036426 [Oryza meyeriana var. granulata]